MENNRDIVNLVVEDLHDRAVFGIKHYGVPLLLDNTKKDALWEAYEEALDLCIYLRLELERRGQETGFTQTSGTSIPET